jgi:hypothetical protein
MRIARYLVLSLLSAVWIPAIAAEVPMKIEGGRPYVDVTLVATDGTRIVAHAWVDTGGGAVILTRALATKLQLKVLGAKAKNEGETLIPVSMPALLLNDMSLALEGGAYEIDSTKATLQETDADIAIPGRALAAYDVVFDYPAGRFSVNAAAGAKPMGTPSAVSIAIGMPVVSIRVDDKKYGFLLDTGGTNSMVSSAIMDVWAAKHGNWPRIDGTFGQGDMGLGKQEPHYSMMRIDVIEWGTFQLDNVAVVSRPVGNYEKFMSGLLRTPIVGSIGGNVLQRFRVEIDYPSGKLYLTKDERTHEDAIDMVGVTLEPANSGGYEVARIHGDVGGLEVGDRILKVDGQDLTQVPLSTIIMALSGKPGTIHDISVQRDNQVLTFSVKTQCLLGTLKRSS